jgi:putative peptidoglycan lipid II flippase
VIIATLLSLPGAGETEWELGDVLTDDRLRWTLGLGATAGIAAMALVLVPAVWRTGYHFRPAWTWRHPAVRRLLVLSGWTLGYVVSNQVALAFVRNLAEPGSGDAAAYFYAFTFFVLPHGLLAVSIATTFQPEMARAVSRRDRDGFIHHASLGTRMVALLTMPAGVAIFVLRQPIIGFTLQRGNFDAADTADTARALAGFSLGLVGFSVYLFVLRGFYAHQDTRTPFVVNVVENLLNIVLAIVLVDRYGVLGLGLAFALAYLLSALWVLQVMSYKVPGFPLGAVLASLARMTLAVVLMAEVMWLVARAVGGDTGGPALARIVAAGVAGLVVYVGVLLALRAPELEFVRKRLPRARH